MEQSFNARDASAAKERPHRKRVGDWGGEASWKTEAAGLSQRHRDTEGGRKSQGNSYGFHRMHRWKINLELRKRVWASSRNSRTIFEIIEWRMLTIEC